MGKIIHFIFKNMIMKSDFVILWSKSSIFDCLGHYKVLKSCFIVFKGIIGLLDSTLITYNSLEEYYKLGV
jgi:hypothetical protein